MDNFEVTQNAIYEKMLSYVQSDEKKNTLLQGEQRNIDIAYNFLNKMIEAQNITSARPVLTRKKGFLGKIVIIIKKIIRRLVFWYVEPLCKSQTYYNEVNAQFGIQMFYQTKEMLDKSAVLFDSQVVNEIQGITKILQDLNDKNDKYEQIEKNIKQVVDMLEENRKKIEDSYKTQKWQIENLQSAVRSVEEKNKEQSWYIDQLQQQNERFSAQYAYMSQKLMLTSEEMSIVKREMAVAFEKTGEDFWDKSTVAQSGEDSIIAYVLMVLGVDLKNERYLDLGANHAKELSNTYMLYKKGMRGVLVEANPTLVQELKFYRNEDVILNKCIADEMGEGVEFYILNGDGLSSMDLDSINDSISKNPNLHIEKTILIDTITVNYILEKFFDKPPLVLNIDVEGMEEKILSSLDYEHFAPFIIVVERIEYGTSIATKKRNDNIEKIMEEHDYFEYAFTGINSIFVNMRQLEERKR